ncbi:MAG: radical SAM domain-containing protein [Actinomycetota bacterium]|nr:radical SAM domain-containing protein [Actinomycetota bacterium]
MGLLERLSELLDATRPAPPEVRAALARRWSDLPESARTPGQLLGRRTTGCEGTHGVFPQCDLGCRPCYHSTDANRVRVDGPHTIAEVDAQMGFLRRVRGPGAYAQLIGGEVTLLDPDDHAAALAVMRSHGREPMSFSHGDVDYPYLERLALGPDGRPRVDHLAFAVHIDSTMRGRRAVPRPTSEAELHPERARVAALFARLEREHGVRTYLAHNMTVTPDNLDEVADVIRAGRGLGYRMFSFQPAAYVGAEGRWSDGYRSFGADEVWAQIEAGAGTRLPYRGVHLGDVRCNRSTWGAFVGDRYVTVIDEDDPADLAARDAFYRAFPGSLGFGSTPVRLVRVARSVAALPAVVPALVGWARRFVRRAGGVRAIVRHRPRPVTFVMHRFMDAADVSEAWAMLEQDEAASEPRLVETQERLRACVYGMAHPEQGRVVPACVQHSVLDPVENARLVRLLPRRPTTAPAGSGG